MNSMTIADLIQKLQEFPPDSLVLVDGYEGGLDAVTDAKIINIIYHEDKEWYYRPYEESKNSDQMGIYLLSTRGRTHD